MFHYTETAHGARFSDRFVIGFPPAETGARQRSSLGVVFRTGRRSGSLPEPAASDPPGTIRVLSLSTAEDDHAVLERTFRDSSLTLYPNCRLKLKASPTLESALGLLRTHRIPIVLCDRDGQPDAWREILRASQPLPAPPCVIVTSRLAGDQQWAELLNEGAFDLLSKPFNPSDVIRIVHSAWVHWHNRYGGANGG